MAPAPPEFPNRPPPRRRRPRSVPPQPPGGGLPDPKPDPPAPRTAAIRSPPHPPGGGDPNTRTQEACECGVRAEDGPTFQPTGTRIDGSRAARSPRSANPGRRRPGALLPVSVRSRNAGAGARPRAGATPLPASPDAARPRPYRCATQIFTTSLPNPYANFTLMWYNHCESK